MSVIADLTWNDPTRENNMLVYMPLGVNPQRLVMGFEDLEHRSGLISLTEQLFKLFASIDVYLLTLKESGMDLTADVVFWYSETGYFLSPTNDHYQSWLLCLPVSFLYHKAPLLLPCYVTLCCSL